MSDSDATFETALADLEKQRERGESEYFAHLQELRDRLHRLQAAAAAAEGAARAAEDQHARRVALAELAMPAVGSAPRLDAHEPTAVAWPRASGARGMLNRFVRWLLRDFLVVLDQRQQATAEAAGRHAADAQRALHEMAAREQPFSATLQALAGRQDSLLLELHELQHVQGRLHTLIEATRAVAGRLGEVVDLLEGGAEQLRLLADVKDAETLQRAVHGPLRRMDLLFDEVARQQEALLAELVGKRGELEALVARLQAPGAP